MLFLWSGIYVYILHFHPLCLKYNYLSSLIQFFLFHTEINFPMENFSQCVAPHKMSRYRRQVVVTRLLLGPKNIKGN